MGFCGPLGGPGTGYPHYVGGTGPLWPGWVAPGGSVGGSALVLGGFGGVVPWVVPGGGGWGGSGGGTGGGHGVCSVSVSGGGEDDCSASAVAGGVGEFERLVPADGVGDFELVEEGDDFGGAVGPLVAGAEESEGCVAFGEFEFGGCPGDAGESAVFEGDAAVGEFDLRADVDVVAFGAAAALAASGVFCRRGRGVRR